MYNNKDVGLAIRQDKLSLITLSDAIYDVVPLQILMFQILMWIPSVNKMIVRFLQNYGTVI